MAIYKCKICGYVFDENNIEDALNRHATIIDSKYASSLIHYFYEDPCENYFVIGVTGTNAKTSITIFLKEILTSLQAIIKTIMASNAGLAIFPIQDLLGYGSDTRLNVPGRAEGNWLYRAGKDAIDNVDSSYYRHINSLFRR